MALKQFQIRHNTLQLKRGTAAEWASEDPVLSDGELGMVIDTQIMKLGNGRSRFSSLPSFVGAGGGAAAFTDLQDVDVDYSGNEGKLPFVNEDASGLTLTPGASQSLILNAGDDSADGNGGGYVYISGGDDDATGNGGGGHVVITGGADAGGGGGDVSITGGVNTTVGGYAGEVEIEGGPASFGGLGGGVRIKGGNGLGVAGGEARLSGGSSNAANAGDINLYGGDASGVSGDGGSITLTVGTSESGAAGLIFLVGLPATNPAVAGAIWSDAGTLKISAG